MDRTNVPRRLLRVAGRLAAYAASLSLMCIAPAFADQLEQHNELVEKFVNDMHADPLVADCAAHGSFVASTSTVFDHVEFPPSSFDSAHSAVTPWNDSFDEGKQHVKIDSIVVDPSDPIIRSYERAFPKLFKPLSAIQPSENSPPLSAPNHPPSQACLCSRRK